MSHWQLPTAMTRVGASHRRKGSPCQDCSGWRTLSDRDGFPIQLMAVADGHGGQRYTHSQAGSKLACELALELAGSQLKQSSTSSPRAIEQWHQWLEKDFAETLHQHWLRASQQHWAKEGHSNESFEPHAYGTTLALVIMTPTWWAHTGLGDWDLVKINNAESAVLICEEAESAEASGEATFSLCLGNAPKYFKPRTNIYPIEPSQHSFGLMLSTDGVRKSCSTDTDFYKISCYLSDLHQSIQTNKGQLPEADLDRISSQGSGDDISVALGFWHQDGAPSSRINKRRRDSGNQIVQPQGGKISLHQSRQDRHAGPKSEQGPKLRSTNKRKGHILLRVFILTLAAAATAGTAYWAIPEIQQLLANQSPNASVTKEQETTQKLQPGSNYANNPNKLSLYLELSQKYCPSYVGGSGNKAKQELTTLATWIQWQKHPLPSLPPERSELSPETKRILESCRDLFNNLDNALEDIIDKHLTKTTPLSFEEKSSEATTNLKKN